jgi:Carboxypeptidase regulatory-like domain
MLTGVHSTGQRPHGRKMKSLLLIAVLLSARPQGAVPTANGTIEGSVTLSRTSEPLVDIHVTADRGLEATTDSAGHFKLRDVPPDRYFVYVQDQRLARPSKGGYSKSVVVGPGEVVRNVDLTMLHTGILTGRLTYTDGKPVVGVEVEAIEPDYRPGQIILGGAVGTWRMARTDNSGTYRTPPWSRVNIMSVSKLGFRGTGFTRREHRTHGCPTHLHTSGN